MNSMEKTEVAVIIISISCESSFRTIIINLIADYL